MANTVIRLKKSSISGHSPTTLEHGELAINYTDGKLFYKDDANVIQRISGGANSFMYMNVNSTMLVAGVLADVLTVNAGDNIEINTDALTNKYTITANLLPAFRVANAAFALANDMYNVSTVVSNTAPANPVQGKLWWNSILGTMFVYYVDPDGTASWVEAVPNGGGVTGGGGTTANLTPVFQVANGAFDKANAANVLAYNTGIGANNYAGVMANAANVYAASLTPNLAPVFIVANAAFNAANNAVTDYSPAFNKANAAYVVANAAFDKANTTGYSSSSVTSMPTGDLAELETYVGQTTSADAFGVSLIPTFNLMDPIGRLETTDFGTL